MYDYLIDATVIIALILINGILAMTELAVVSSNKAKLSAFDEKNRGAKRALYLLENPGKFLPTIQVGITIVGVISGTFSGQRFAEPLGAWLNQISAFENEGYIIAFSSIVLLITYISLVIGELVPKRIALSNPEKLASILARPVHLLSKIMYPFVALLNYSTEILLKLIKFDHIQKSKVTEEEIHSIMKQGYEEGAINQFEHKTLQEVLRFSEREASAIMTPRISMVYLDLNDSIDKNRNKILQNPYRYYPVFEGGFDNLRGVIDSKDALVQQMQGHSFTLEALIKDVICVLKDNFGPNLLEQFKNTKTKVAMVVDEYGTIHGMITLVDLVETLIGTLLENRTDQNNDIIIHQDGSILCNGLAAIEDIEELLNIKILDDDSDFHTLAGFLLTYFEDIPKCKASLEFKDFTFEIVAMDKARIHKVLIKKIA
jgi:putative hemolysin